MGKRRYHMQNAQSPAPEPMGFDRLRNSAAPYVSAHRMTVGRPPHLPCFAGQFGIDEIAEGHTVHLSQIDAETEFETSFVARPGLLVTIVLDGTMEFWLDGNAHVAQVTNTPVAMAWVNRQPVDVRRRTRRDEHLIKAQLHLPPSALGPGWEDSNAPFSQSHTQVHRWRPGLAACDAAQGLLERPQMSEARARLATSRFSIEALDSLMAHLEAQSANTATSRIATARSYVEQTAPDRPSLGRIAEDTGYSVSALQRHYRAAFGMTVIEHQRRLLLDRAMTALRDDGISVNEVSRQAGYSSPTNFAAAFTRQFGMCPSKVRSMPQ
ncbi:MAG: AraC family transcriptional regulator [Marinibacterium sp.]|nr:AraC family transcriptional regulator [Marinibacterium sp.]